MTRLAALLLGALLIFVCGVQTGLWVQRTRTVPIELSARPCVENPREQCFSDISGHELRIEVRGHNASVRYASAAEMHNQTTTHTSPSEQPR